MQIIRTNIRMGSSLKVKNIPNEKIIPPKREYLNLPDEIPNIKE
jgi:hypothetical protein